MKLDSVVSCSRSEDCHLLSAAELVVRLCLIEFQKSFTPFTLLVTLDYCHLSIPGCSIVLFTKMLLLETYSTISRTMYKGKQMSESKNKNVIVGEAFNNRLIYLQNKANV